MCPLRWTVLILLNFESVCFFYSNPVFQEETYSLDTLNTISFCSFRVLWRDLYRFHQHQQLNNSTYYVFYYNFLFSFNPTLPKLIFIVFQRYFNCGAWDERCGLYTFSTWNRFLLNTMLYSAMHPSILTLSVWLNFINILVIFNAVCTVNHVWMYR